MSVPSNRRLVRRTVQLFVGLILYGVSMALMVESGLGLNPWDVLHQGLSRMTGLSIGLVVILASVVVLALWIPLRQRPGFGTIANLIVVGLSVDGALWLLPTGEALPVRISFLTAGILVNGLATGLYIGARFGPGPRDGLMTGLHARFPRFSLRVIRTGIELVLLAGGYLLGGTAGLGTIAYALLIGPLAQFFIPLCTVPVAPAPEPSEVDRVKCPDRDETDDTAR